MKIWFSSFKIGLSLVIIGSIWTGIVFSDAMKVSNSFFLDKSNSASISLDLHGSGIGFYIISVNGYSENTLLAKILDSHGTYYDIKKITNKVTVNYFSFTETEKFTLEITDLSDKPVELTAGLGDTRFQDITLSAVLIFMGASLLIFAGYKKLKNYITAHPDENN